MKSILILFISLLLISCQKSEFEKAENKYIQEMKWLYSAKPRNDFEKAIKNKDYRFIGVYGYSISVPGLKIKCLDYDKDINPIKGTSDAVIGYEHSKLIAIAYVYAEAYNFRMKLYREENQGFKCAL